MKRCLFFLACCIALCSAEDITLTDGTVLKNATVTRKGDDFINVIYDGGGRKIAAEELPTELRERFKMTEDILAERREKAQRDEAARAEAAKKVEQETRAALEASGRTARYVTAADVQQMYGPLDSLNSRMADYLAAEWNRREALRLGLKVEAERFADEAAALRGAFEADRSNLLEEAREAEKTRRRVTELDEKLRVAKERNEMLKNQISDLREQVRNRPSGFYNEPTIIVPPPRGPIIVNPIPRRPSHHCKPTPKPKPAAPTPAPPRKPR